jgi:outer membrane protein assembly factor BamB
VSDVLSRLDIRGAVAGARARLPPPAIEVSHGTVFRCARFVPAIISFLVPTRDQGDVMQNDEAVRAETIRPPRLWPLYVIMLLQAVLLVLTVWTPIDNLTRFLFMMAGPAACTLLAAAWLLLFSRLRWLERPIIGAGIVLLGIASAFAVHQTMQTPLWIYGLPLAMVTVTVGLLVAGRRAPAVRTSVVLACVMIGWALFLPGRLDGFDGTYLPEFRWRWSPTPEQRLGEPDVAPAASSVHSAAIALQPGDWPGFRGPARDSRVGGTALDVDWEASPPRERWRIPIGPAWSSFAHVDGRLFTQEQRGDEEAVTCYDAESGQEIWRAAYPTRFTEIVSGPGPRATPTFAEGRLYVTGAKGALLCLDAASGQILWKRDLMRELDAPLPMWGFSASPLVTGDVVIVYAGGRDDHGLVAYDRDSGEPAWHVAGSGQNYGSAQLATLAGVELVLFTNENALLAIDPASGEVPWQHTPEGWRGAPIVQAQAIGDDRLIVAVGDGQGVARLDVAFDGGAWTITQPWTTRRLKPSFNDFVHFEGHLYGFDQKAFTCVDVETGARTWRRGRYGFGQVLLLESSAALLVLAESGEVVLVAADPTAHRELGRVEAMTAKTWNHPIVVGNRLFVRNGEEAVCYDLPGGEALEQ